MQSLVLLAVALAATTSASYNHPIYRRTSDPALAIFVDDRPPECPPCFNCNLDGFPCHQFANCTASNGRCTCPPGWGGDDCTDPLCGSLSKGKDRLPRKGATCECDDGWEGINCNVCTKDDICDALVPGGEGGVCYTGGYAVREIFQQCQVTNKQILDQLKGQIPQVTFACNNGTGTCNFQCMSRYSVGKFEANKCSLG